MDVYVARLRKLASTCEFVDVERELRQQIITGIRDGKVREKAFQKRLAIQELLDQAKSAEQVRRQAEEMEHHGGACGTSQAVHEAQRHPVADFIKVWSYFTTGVNYTLKFYPHAAVVIS